MKFRVLRVLLITAGISSFVSTCASAQIFSVNAVGYVDVTYPAGTNLVANPFNAGDNSVSNLFRNMPNGSAFALWDYASMNFGPTNIYTTGGGWGTPGTVLDGWGGAMLALPVAKTISYAGDLWPDRCVRFPFGLSVFGIFPDRSCGFGFPGYGHFTVIYWRGPWYPYSYDPDFGAWDVEPPPLRIGEAAMYYSDRVFDARSARPSNGGTLASVSYPPRWMRWSRDANQLTLNFSSTTNTTYSLICSTNISSGTWKLVQQQTTDPTNGSSTVAVPLQNGSAFYRITPPFNPIMPVLFSAARHGIEFSFEFCAPSNATYEVQRSATFDGASWQTIRSIAAEANSVIKTADTNATAPLNYYRVKY